MNHHATTDIRSARKLRGFAALALLSVIACSGSTRHGDTNPSGGKSGSAGDAGQGAAGTRGGGETSGAGGTGGVAGSAIDVGGAGTSGVAGSAGAGAGGGGQGGGGGMSGAGGSGGADCGRCVDPVTSKLSDFGVGSWESSWFLTGCKERSDAFCRTIVGTCPDGGARTLETFRIGGLPGQHYKVTFNFNALVEAKTYEGGKRDAGTNVPVQQEDPILDTFYRDGAPVASGYNVWQLSVYDEKGQLARHYYMNSFPNGGGWESHRLFRIGFTKSIVIVGGGKITHLVEDSDCMSVDNCGAGNVPPPPDACTAPRRLFKEPDVLLPAQYQDPSDGLIKSTLALSPTNKDLSQPWHSQLGHLTVTKVEPTSDPVSTDY